MTNEQQWCNIWHYDITYDIRKIWCLMQPPTKQVIILFKIWCGKLMSITLHLTSILLPHGVNMQSTSYIIKYNLTCTFIKNFIGHFVMEIIM